MNDKVRWIKECWQSIGKGIKKKKMLQEENPKLVLSHNFEAK